MALKALSQISLLKFDCLYPEARRQETCYHGAGQMPLVLVWCDEGITKPGVAERIS